MNDIVASGLFTAALFGTLLAIVAVIFGCGAIGGYFFGGLGFICGIGLGFFFAMWICAYMAALENR